MASGKGAETATSGMDGRTETDQFGLEAAAQWGTYVDHGGHDEVRRSNVGQHGQRSYGQCSWADSEHGMAEAVGHSNDGRHRSECNADDDASDAVDGISIQLVRRAAEAGPLDLPTQPSTAAVEAAATTAVWETWAAAAVRLQPGTCGMDASHRHRPIY